MRRLADRSRTWWVWALGAVGFVLIAFVGAIDLLHPGVSVRSIVRGVPLAEPCDPRLAQVRLPLGGRTTEKWQEAARLPRARDEFRAAAAGDHIYVGTGLVPAKGAIGGFASLAELYLFDPASARFTGVSPLPLALDHPAFVTHDGALYVLGGWNDGIPTGRVFRLAQSGDSWEELPSMPTPRAASAAAVVGGRIFVIGGATSPHDGRDLPGVATVEVFDPRTGRWARATDMPTPRHHHAAAAVGDTITVVGGRDGRLFSIAQTEQLDVSSGRWTVGPPLALASGALTAVAAGHRMVVTGGGDDGGGWVTPATWELAPDGRWLRLPDLGTPRHGHGMAAIGDTVYVFGGAPCAGYGASDLVERLDLRRIPAP